MAGSGSKFSREAQPNWRVASRSKEMRIALQVIKSCSTRCIRMSVIEDTLGRNVVATRPNPRRCQQWLPPQKEVESTKPGHVDWLSASPGSARLVKSGGKDRSVGLDFKSRLRPIPIDSPPTSGKKGRDGAAHSDEARHGPRPQCGRTVPHGFRQNYEKDEAPVCQPPSCGQGSTTVSAATTTSSARRSCGGSRLHLGSGWKSDDRKLRIPSGAHERRSDIRPQTGGPNGVAGYLIETAGG